MVNRFKMKQKAHSWRLEPKLQKREIIKFGPELLQCCSKLSDPRSINPDILYFMLKCISDIFQYQKYFHFSPPQQKELIHICKPFEKKIRKISDFTRRNGIIKSLRATKQKGGGIFTTLLITALIPLVQTVIQKLTKK